METIIYPTFFNSAMFVTDNGSIYNLSAYCEPEITNNLFLKINKHVCIYSKENKAKLLADYKRILTHWSNKYSKI